MKKLKYTEAAALLKAAGWKLVRQVGSHQVWERGTERCGLLKYGTKNHDLSPSSTKEILRRARQP